MDTIVLATDGSSSAARATAMAIELATATGAPLQIVTAWEVPISAFGYAPPLDLPEFADAERAKAKEVLDQAVAQAAAAGAVATSELREGEPVEEICAVAHDAGASLVVVGTHGWSGFKRAVFGSVSTGVLHHAPCPVLVVRGDESEGHERARG